MEVEACGREGPVPGVAVGGLEVAGGGEGPGRRVPEAAAEVGDQQQRRPQRGDLRHEGRVLRHAPQRVVQRARPPLDAPRRLVDAQRRRWRGRRRRHGERERERERERCELQFAKWQRWSDRNSGTMWNCGGWARISVQTSSPLIHTNRPGFRPIKQGLERE